MNRLTPQVKGTSRMSVLTEPEYLGELTIRHRLNRRLRYKGGHIGYSVRPTRRRRGHATLMLGLSLPVASQLGIDPALITCATPTSPRAG